jgi:hypothetical protein
MMAIRKADDHELADAAGMDIENIPGAHEETQMEFQDEQAKLERAGKISKWTTVAMTIVLLVLWPFPLYGSGYIFSKSFFTGWVTVGIIWIFCSLGAVGLFPIFVGRHTLVRTVKAMISGRKPTPAIHAAEVVGDKGSGSPGNATPPEKAVKEDITAH